MKLVLGVACAALIACSKRDRTTPAPVASFVANASATVNPPPSARVESDASVQEPLPPPPPTCRAVRVVGEARLAGRPLLTGDAVDGGAWLELPPQASLTIKHSTSGRELSISGPARLRACRRGREQLLLVRGVVHAGAGMGVRPGSEVVLATPVAALRYASAELKLDLSDDKLEVRVNAGQVEVDAASDQALKTPLRAKDRLSVAVGKPDPVALMERCRGAAELAVATGRKVGDASASESLGQRASAHVKTRRSARSKCAIAGAALGLVADPEQSAGLWADAERWEALWETVPSPMRAKPAEK